MAMGRSRQSSIGAREAQERLAHGQRIRCGRLDSSRRWSLAPLLTFLLLEMSIALVAAAAGCWTIVG
jgi:hypothetical protein